MGIDRPQPLVQEPLAVGDELLKVGLDGDRQDAGLLQFLQRRGRDQPFLEGAILPAASDPDVAGAQPVAQLRQDAELVVASVDGARGRT